MVAARRLQLGRDRRSDTQVRGGTGVFTGKPALRLDLEPDRQHRRADRFEPDRRRHRRRSRSTRIRTSTSRPTSPARRRASYELNVTDPDFKFPQVWRTNIAVDRRLPWGHHRHRRSTSTTRTSTASTTSTPTCRRRSRPSPAPTTGRAGSGRHARRPGRRAVRHAAQQRPGQPGHARLRAEEPERGQLVELRAASSKNTQLRPVGSRRLQLRRGEEPVDPESTAATSFSRNAHSGDPNNPGLGISLRSPGHRVFALVNYHRASTSASAPPRSRCSGKRATARSTARRESATCLPAT